MADTFDLTVIGSGPGGYVLAGADGGTFSFGAEWNVKPTPTLIEELETLLGRGRIAVLYSPPPTASASSYG